MTPLYLLAIIFIVIACIAVYVLVDKQFDFNKCRLLKDGMLSPVTKFVSRLGFSAVFFSAVSLVFGIFAAISYVFSFKYFIIFISFGALCDVLDGSIARFTHTDSSAGRFIDYSFDRIVMICVSVAVFLSIKDPAWYYIALPIYKLVPNAIFLLNSNKFKFLPLVPTMYFYYVLLIFDAKIATIGALVALSMNTFQILFRSFLRPPRNS